MLTIEMPKAVLLGFTVGLTGALVPVPYFLRLEASLKRGWLAGPEVALGHILVEFVLSVLILFGAASLVGSGTISAISFIGGLELVLKEN
jgi:threonine/homoserine/homoserine lactone efflux protein